MQDFLINKIKELSKFRIKPLCKEFGLCSGCNLQDISYEKQLEIKKDWLFFCLEKEGFKKQEINFEAIFPSPSIYFYRNKMEFAFGMEGEKLILGMRESKLKNKSHQKKVVPIGDCLIFSKKTKEIFSIILDNLAFWGLPAYDPYTKKGFFRHLVIREAKNTSQIMVCLVSSKEPHLNIDILIENLKDIPEVKSIYWIKNEAVADVVKYENKYLLYGESFIEERLNNLRFRIYPENFFQPNTEATCLLYRKIFENLEEKTKILGLYCGSGAMEIYLAKKLEQVIGVDCEPSNIKTALENAEINGIKNSLFLCERVEKFLTNFKSKDFHYLIVDPPRSGISYKAIKKILKLDIANLIYVSCNPLSFAKDLKILKENNYKIKKIFAFDFTPHSLHLEVMAILYKSI